MGGVYPHPYNITGGYLMGKKIARRRCKCAACGADGWNDEFFRVELKNRNVYYCNEDEYLAEEREKECREETLQFIASDIWLEPDYRMLPTVLQKNLNELAEIYSHEAILRAVKSEQDTLHYWMNLDGKFSNEFGKARYFISILSNGAVKQAYNQIKREKAEERRAQKIREESAMNDINIASLDETLGLQQEAKSKKSKPVNNGIMDMLEGVDI